MVKVEKISIAEAKATRRMVKKSPIIQEYEEILNSLKPGQAFRIDASVEKEKPQTIKNRIIRLGKSLGMDGLRVQRRGDKISFWIDLHMTTKPPNKQPESEEQS